MMESRSKNAPKSGVPTIFHSKLGLSFTLLVLIIFIISGIATYALREIKSHKSEEIEGTLRTILTATHEALIIWADDHIDDLQYWASRPDVKEMVRGLLTIPKDRESLASSKYLEDLRETFQPVLEDHGHLGFFIVCPDYINIASLRDENLGKINLLVGEKDYLERLFKGEEVMTTPLRTDVPLPGKGGKLSLEEPTMFIGVPVFDEGKNVIAGLLIRINPAEDFSRIAKLGRLGETGETYLVDRDGLLISESRFDSQLVKAGLVKEGERGILKISVRDPGVNLLEGKSSTLLREKRPLTLMAKSVIEGDNGANLEGYNDYRGVPVVGVWLWDHRFGLGMTTEIDFAEAFQNYHFTRNVVVAVLLFTVLLFLILSVILMKSRRVAIILKQRAEKFTRETNAVNEMLEIEVEERKLAQEELWHSQQALEKAHEIARLGTWEYDVVNNDIVWSDEVYRIFGVEIETFDNTFDSFIGLIHPDDREYVQGEIKTSMDNKKPFSIDYRIVLAGGEIRYVHEEAEDISDEKGKPIRRIGTVQDITERKEAEKEIASLAKFPSENPFPVMQISASGKILYANDASQPILNVWGLEGGRLLSTMKSFIAGVYEEGKSREVEVEQGEQTFSISFIPVKESDYVYAYGLDVTGRKNAEMSLLEAKKIAESATRAKSEFLANMSHEIRTPMTSIIGMAELLSESDLTDKEKDYVERLKGSGDSLLSIINDILDLSKIESGRIDLEEIEFNVAEEIEKIISIYGVLAHDKGIRLIKDISSDVQVNRRGDPTRLRQVLVNLIGNAIKFTDEGEIRVNFERSPDDEMAIFTITDSGTGISEDKLETIFDEFSQADTSTTRTYGGTGLGLTISRKLVELMGGGISVESEVGKGAAFCFSVRMKAGSAKISDNKKETKADDGGVERPLNILLVDDSEDNRLLIKTFMKGSQHSLDMAENGEEAFEKFMEKRYDLLLMDMQMPVMDGYEATKIIRRWEEDKNIKETPIIAFTAHALKEEVERCLDAGCTDHLAKPVKKKDLIEMIRSYAV